MNSIPDFSKMGPADRANWMYHNRDKYSMIAIEKRWSFDGEKWEALGTTHVLFHTGEDLALQAERQAREVLDQAGKYVTAVRWAFYADRLVPDWHVIERGA